MRIHEILMQTPDYRATSARNSYSASSAFNVSSHIISTTGSTQLEFKGRRGKPFSCMMSKKC